MEDATNLRGGVALAGGAAMALGFVLDERDSAFRVRAIHDGVAIERGAVSFSATATGQMKLEKRWEF